MRITLRSGNTKEEWTIETRTLDTDLMQEEKNEHMAERAKRQTQREKHKMGYGE